MAETKILEDMTPYKGGFGFYFDGKNVNFKERSLFDRNTDEWNSIYCSFNPDNYRKGISELIENGKCKINGENSHMSLTKTDYGIRLDATQFINHSTSSSTNVLLKWDAEELLKVLPL